MEDRHHRRALPARGHVRSAKIVDHGNAEPPSERASVAELHGEPAFRLVRDRLAVKADHRDIARGRAEAKTDRRQRDLGEYMLNNPNRP
jgi:hypothetical protein